MEDVIQINLCCIFIADLLDMTIYFKRLTSNAIIPKRNSEWSAGVDLYVAHNCTILSHDRGLVLTDLAAVFPAKTYGRIAPRSGLALYKFIDIGADVIDGDFRGNIGVVIFNHGSDSFFINKGDRIAQIICTKIVYTKVCEIETLDDTERGDSGFGSSGIVTK